MTNKKILLLRHGETDWNAQLRFQGSKDIPLNTNGEDQARCVSHRISAWLPEVVYSSPLQRALKTAQLTAGHSFGKINIIEDLCEINFGIWEGKTIADLKEQGELFNKWAQEPFSLAVPEAETERQILTRVERVLEIIIESPKERILIVSHGGTLRALLSAALDIPFRSAWRNFRMSNCSLTGLEFTGQKFILAFYNDHITNDDHTALTDGVLPICF